MLIWKMMANAVDRCRDQDISLQEFEKLYNIVQSSAKYCQIESPFTESEVG